MGHVYASVSELKNYIRDAGATALGTTNDALYLSFLEDASAAIDAYCRRGGSGDTISGFGPRIGTNYYDGPGGTTLDIRDDLLSITSVATADAVGSTPLTYTDETDFYKLPYGGPRYRQLDLHGLGYVSWFGAPRGVALTGSYGYQDVRVTLTPTIIEAVDTTETAIDVSGLTDLSPGLTILVDSEQMYVTGITDSVTDSITVVRGVNGTTAASHLTASAMARYVYPRQVNITCLRLALRRWRTRDSGADGSEGGGDTPVMVMRESEDTILRRGVGNFRFYRV